MKNFKPGQPVVFDTKGQMPWLNCSDPSKAVMPKDGDIVTIDNYDGYRGGDHMYILVEFKYTKHGIMQAFADTFLFPLEEAHAKATENLIKALETKIQKTFEPVEV